MAQAVTTLSNQKLELVSAEEKRFYEEAQEKYSSENSFSAASDLRALERLILFETLMFRWQKQLASNQDIVFGGPLSSAEAEKLRKNLKEGAVTISQLHNDLGLSKSQRDKEKFESVGSYIVNLLNRAKEMGVNRENQLDRSLVLINELFAKVGAFYRSNEKERRKMGIDTEATIVEWIRDEMRPRYDEIDEYFQVNSQKYWIRSL